MTDRKRPSLVDGGAGGERCLRLLDGIEGESGILPSSSPCAKAWCGVQGRHTPPRLWFRGAKALTRIQPAHGWPLGRVWNGKGQERSFLMGVHGGDRSLTLADETADVSLVQTRLDADGGAMLGDATGARSGPLAKWARYYRAHLAVRLKAIVE